MTSIKFLIFKQKTRFMAFSINANIKVMSSNKDRLVKELQKYKGKLFVTFRPRQNLELAFKTFMKEKEPLHINVGQSNMEIVDAVEIPTILH